MTDSKASVAAAELIKAFRAFDLQRVGWLPTSMVRVILDKFGDLSASEREEFFLEADQEGRVHYEHFVNEVLFSRVK